MIFRRRAEEAIDAGACRLRPWKAADVPVLTRLANNRHIAARVRDRFPHPYTRAHARAWVRRARAHRPSIDFAIVGNEALVGGLSLAQGTDVERCSAELGYWIGEPYWNQGFATAAVRAAVPALMRRLGLTRVFALPFTDNAASCRVLEKSGFVREGVLRRSAIKDGVVKDQALYARLDTDPSRDG